MTKDTADGRIEARVSAKMKEQYRRHAVKRYGMKLATWLKMLAHRDFTAPQDE